VVAYDGSGFAGFAAQPPGVRTVAGSLSSAIGKVLGHRVELTCAGRTDAGVHAWGQVVSFDASADRFDPVKLQRSVNKLLGPAIVVRSIGAAADPEFNARFSALTRRYRYTVLNDPVADPFLAGTAWWVPQPLDVRLLRLACDPLIGEHDFSSFCRRPDRLSDGGAASLVRRVHDARWEVDDGGRILRFWIEANAFCQQMVRSIAGTIVDCGLGKRHPGDIAAILRAQDRSAAGTVAPPHGLCLWEVEYSTQ
jgi:tRNA pseudouridine38-40 synthase